MRAIMVQPHSGRESSPTVPRAPRRSEHLPKVFDSLPTKVFDSFSEPQPCTHGRARYSSTRNTQGAISAQASLASKYIMTQWFHEYAVPALMQRMTIINCGRPACRSHLQLHTTSMMLHLHRRLRVLWWCWSSLIHLRWSSLSSGVHGAWFCALCHHCCLECQYHIRTRTHIELFGNPT